MSAADDVVIDLTEKPRRMPGKTDRMLTKILQKLHRLSPQPDQNVVEENSLKHESGETEKVTVSEPDDCKQSSEHQSDSSAVLAVSEDAMEPRKRPAGHSTNAGSRFGRDRQLSNEHIYANGGIHQDGLEVDRLCSDRNFQRPHKNAVDNLSFAGQELINDSSKMNSLPRFKMSLVKDEEEPPLLITNASTTRYLARQTKAGTEPSNLSEPNSSARTNHLYLSSGQEHEEIPPDLKCSMCQREYDEPRLLPCLHSFCCRCLEEEVEHRTENRIRCPKCQRDFDLTRFPSVRGLPTNFVVTSMIDKAALERYEKVPISCSSCEEKLPATVRCTDCMDYLCSTCHIAHHRLRLTKGHQILALQDIIKSKNVAELLHRPMFCSHHIHEKIRFYCESCDQAICRDCTMGNHSSRDHRYCSVSDAIEKQRLFIEQLSEKVRLREPMLRRAIQAIQEVDKRLEAKAEMARAEINKCYPRLLKALEERHKFMLNEVDKMFHGKSKVLNLQQRRLETDLDNLTNTCKVTEDVLRHGNETEILVVKKMISDRLEELYTTKISHEPEENDVVYFNAQEETMLKAIRGLGSVKVSSAYAALSCVVGGLKRVPQGKRSSFTVHTRDHYGAQCSEGGERLQARIQSTTGDYTLAEVCDNRDGSYTVSFCPSKLGTHRVSVCIQNEHVQGSPFTVQVVQSGGMILKFGRKGSSMGEFNGIFGVAVDPLESRIVVTDCHNHRVQVFNSDGQFLFYFGRKGEGSGEFQCPTGVAIDVRGQIIVCERLSYRLQVFSRDGSFLREYRIPDLKASTLAVGEADQIVIADSANRCVHVVNMETAHSIKFGSFGDERGELSYPCYVTVNQRGHIIVSDMHSHKIQVFDSRGQFLFNFGKKGSLEGELLRPTGVAVSREGHIVVADRDNHRVQIFSTDGKFLHKFGSKGDGDGQLNDPHGLAVTKDGSIVVADFRNNRVQVFGRLG